MLEYELYHLNRDNRQDGTFIEVLHPEYKEFGQSGRIYTYKDFEGRRFTDDSKYEITEFNVQVLSDESQLCTYVLLNQTLGTKTNRSSIWVRYEDDWKMLFHQGTRNFNID